MKLEKICNKIKTEMKKDPKGILATATFLGGGVLAFTDGAYAGFTKTNWNENLLITGSTISGAAGMYYMNPKHDQGGGILILPAAVMYCAIAGLLGYTAGTAAEHFMR